MQNNVAVSRNMTGLDCLMKPVPSIHLMYTIGSVVMNYNRLMIIGLSLKMPIPLSKAKEDSPANRTRTRN